MPVRALKELIVTPVQIVLVYLLLKSQVIQMIQARLNK
ncbi:Substrate-specific component FolT of folate ECF transporter [Levilactobacillus brevis]|nr:Substrate-specific component FolT of folate ECF transporter [Levilactobacillus brevis]